MERVQCLSNPWLLYAFVPMPSAASGAGTMPGTRILIPSLLTQFSLCHECPEAVRSLSSRHRSHGGQLLAPPDEHCNPGDRPLPKRARQFHPKELIDAVVSGPEVPVLDVAYQILREDRVA